MKKLLTLLLLTVLSFSTITTFAVQAQAQHLKKDGTPDKRFKSSTPAPATKHLKKDGTPDKRFKENKKKS